MPGNPEPSKQTLLWCMDIATTKESAWYLYEEVSKRLGKSYGDLCQKFYAFAEEVEEGTNWVMDAWGGQSVPKTTYQSDAEKRVQQAEEAAVSLPVEHINEVNVDINFTDEGELKRTYSENGEVPQDDALVDRLDTTMHGWLAKESLACKDEKIFEADEHGYPKVDDDGVAVQVELAELKGKLEDGVAGFEPYVKQHMLDTEIRELNVTIPEGPELGPAGSAAAAG